jgi:molybdenum ABC transporter molybdate-binding protein
VIFEFNIYFFTSFACANETGAFMITKFLRICCVLGLFLFLSAPELLSAAPTVCTNKTGYGLKLAVASNLYEAAQNLATVFQSRSSTIVEVCHNATGELVREILAGTSNYDLFLAADTTSVNVLCDDNSNPCFTPTGSQQVFPYIRGRLVFFSANNLIDLENAEDIVDNNSIISVAYANTTDAPYGTAAFQYMEITGQWDALFDDGNGKLVNPPYDNIALTFQAVANGTNTAGFVASSQICSAGVLQGNYVIIPPESYDPIIQSGAILNTPNTSVAEDFKEFLLDDSPAPVPGGQTILVNQFCYFPVTVKSPAIKKSSLSCSPNRFKFTDLINYKDNFYYLNNSKSQNTQLWATNFNFLGVKQSESTFLKLLAKIERNLIKGRG